VSDGAKKNIMVASRTVWNGILYSIHVPTSHSELSKFVEPFIGWGKEGEALQVKAFFK
jgi:hypothetical protein